MKKDLQGVYCHKPGTSRKAENYLVFENVFSNGHWWGAMLELSVDRAVGKTVGDQWVQPAESVILRALWVCGRTHDQMKDSTCFWVSPWDPKVEVNPSTIFANGVTPLRAKRDMQAFKTEQIGQALTRSLPVYGGPSTETLILEAEREAAALQARQHSLAGTSEAVSASDSQMELDALDDDKTADNRDSDVDLSPIGMAQPTKIRRQRLGPRPIPPPSGTRLCRPRRILGIAKLPATRLPIRAALLCIFPLPRSEHATIAGALIPPCALPAWNP